MTDKQTKKNNFILIFIFQAADQAQPEPSAPPLPHPVQPPLSAPSEATGPAQRVIATPLAKKLAAEKGLDLTVRNIKTETIMFTSSGTVMSYQ